MRVRRSHATGATGATLTAVALLAATNTAQGPAPAQTGGTAPRYVVMGCLTRETAKTAESAARARYVVTDARADPPARYVLEGDRETLERHVGHQIEVAGPLTRTSSDSQTLKVASLVYIAESCPQVKKP